MSGWRAWIDRERLNRLYLAHVGICGAWGTVHGLDQRQRYSDFAAQAIVRYERLIDKPMMTGDIIWRCAYISTAKVLEREYRANLTGSHEYEGSGDVAYYRNCRRASTDAPRNSHPCFSDRDGK